MEKVPKSWILDGFVLYLAVMVLFPGLCFSIVFPEKEDVEQF